MVVLASVTGGGIFPLVVTLLVVALFYAVTLHLAATLLLGEVPSQRAAYVAPVPAVTSILLQQYGVAITVAVTLLADGATISAVYRLKARSAAVLAVVHFAFAAVLGLALNNLFGFVA